MDNESTFHVLVVDDNRTSRTKLSIAVKNLGHVVELAKDGQQALAMLHETSFDLVLLDILMPVLDGYAVLEYMKEDSQLTDIPVVVISALDDMESVVKCIELGADDYLPKIFNPVLLRARIGACLEKKRLRDQETEYLHQVNRLTTAAAAIETSTFVPDSLTEVVARTDALGQLARVFQRMVAEIKLREQNLKQQVQELRVEIDQSMALQQIINSNTSRLPEGGAESDAVYKFIRDELSADGNPDQNLASFVTTEMDDTATNLALDSINKNLINSAEYPQTESIHQSVIAMIARLFSADVPSNSNSDQDGAKSLGFVGTTTVGSSEAVMLALLAHKWNWKKRQSSTSGRSTKDRPYLIIGTHMHACFVKFARYFEVGVKWVYLEPGCYAVQAEQVGKILESRIGDDPEIMQECGYTSNEVEGRTIGELVMAIGCVVGSTYTGDIDDVAGIDQILYRGNWDIPIHVDAASSGFVLPFAPSIGDGPALQWDFKLTHVESINVSNHKYGLVYPGLGTIVFRNPWVVPEELLVDVNYLSGEMRNYSLNFSRPSTGVILQYYNFLRLGKTGYEEMIKNCLDNAQYIARSIDELPTLKPYLEVVSRTEYLPVVVFQLKDIGINTFPFALTALAEVLKVKGWIVPVYRMPPNVENIEVMRVVVRPHFDREMANSFLDNLQAAIIVCSEQS